MNNHHRLNLEIDRDRPDSTARNTEPHLFDRHTDDCVRNEDMEKAIAVEVELEQGWYSLAGRYRELSVAICTAGDIDAVFEQVESAHNHIL